MRRIHGLQLPPGVYFPGRRRKPFIGASLALLSLADARDHTTGLVTLVSVPVLLLLIPIFDAVFVTITRRLSARRATVGGRDHTSHRLVAMGFTERQAAVLLLYGFAAAAGMAAILWTACSSGRRGAGGHRGGDAVTARGAPGGNPHVQWRSLHQPARSRVHAAADRVHLTERRLFEVLLDLALVILAYYGAYVIRFDRDLPQYHNLLIASLPEDGIGCQLVSFSSRAFVPWRLALLHDRRSDHVRQGRRPGGGEQSARAAVCLSFRRLLARGVPDRRHGAASAPSDRGSVSVRQGSRRAGPAGCVSRRRLRRRRRWRSVGYGGQPESEIRLLRRGVHR